METTHDLVRGPGGMHSPEWEASRLQPIMVVGELIKVSVVRDGARGFWALPAFLLLRTPGTCTALPGCGRHPCVPADEMSTVSLGVSVDHQNMRWVKEAIRILPVGRILWEMRNTTVMVGPYGTHIDSIRRFERCPLILNWRPVTAM